LRLLGAVGAVAADEAASRRKYAYERNHKRRGNPCGYAHIPALAGLNILWRAFLAYALHYALMQVFGKFVAAKLADAVEQRAAMVSFAPAFGARQIMAFHLFGPLAFGVIPYCVFKFTAFHRSTIFAAYLLLNTAKSPTWFRLFTICSHNTGKKMI
jgi:hypothetical protein